MESLLFVPPQASLNSKAHFLRMTDPYQVTIGGVKADPYRVLRAYGITCPIIGQAIKKLLRCGRKHKDISQDVREAITTLERWEEIEKEDKNK